MKSKEVNEVKYQSRIDDKEVLSGFKQIKGNDYTSRTLNIIDVYNHALSNGYKENQFIYNYVIMCHVFKRLFHSSQKINIKRRNIND
jgi:hypothetical protein